MTTPETQQRFGLTAFYRLLARWSLLYLGSAYTAAITIVLILHHVATTSGSPAADWFAGLIGVLAFSVLFTVVTWYRDEDNLAAAVVIVALTGVGYLLAAGFSDIVATGSIATLVFGVAGGFFAMLIRIALLSPVAMALVWGGRRLRRYFAPATLNNENLP